MQVVRQHVKVAALQVAAPNGCHETSMSKIEKISGQLSHEDQQQSPLLLCILHPPPPNWGLSIAALFVHSRRTRSSQAMDTSANAPDRMQPVVQSNLAADVRICRFRSCSNCTHAHEAIAQTNDALRQDFRIPTSQAARGGHEFLDVGLADTWQQMQVPARINGLRDFQKHLLADAPSLSHGHARSAIQTVEAEVLAEISMLHLPAPRPECIQLQVRD
mmetsp:Transcript_148374/g.476472  ORF Transcript_148374/g.476472 Transcript_148374/m.476472 type:complete len:218 (-) Transcript_148374:258-911(-)